MTVGGSVLARAIHRFAPRLRFPRLFALFLVLAVVDMIVPDFIPFADEILLALLATLFGMWQERSVEPPKPPEKDVTPGRR